MLLLKDCLWSQGQFREGEEMGEEPESPERATHDSTRGQGGIPGPVASLSGVDAMLAAPDLAAIASVIPLRLPLRPRHDD
jgi:hypothetical protein